MNCFVLYTDERERERKVEYENEREKLYQKSVKFRIFLSELNRCKKKTSFKLKYYK